MGQKAGMGTEKRDCLPTPVPDCKLFPFYIEVHTPNAPRSRGKDNHNPCHEHTGKRISEQIEVQVSPIVVFRLQDSHQVEILGHIPFGSRRNHLIQGITDTTAKKPCAVRQINGVRRNAQRCQERPEPEQHNPLCKYGQHNIFSDTDRQAALPPGRHGLEGCTRLPKTHGRSEEKKICPV